MKCTAKECVYSLGKEDICKALEEKVIYSASTSRTLALTAALFNVHKLSVLNVL